MSDHNERLGTEHKKPELTEADKAVTEAEPNWDRMGQIAKRLMATPPGPKATRTANPPSLPTVKQAGRSGG